MERPGPVLVAEVLNRSDEERVFSYEFETADRSSTGSGEGVIPPCTSMVESWAEITGSYTLRLDDEVLVEDRLAAGQGDGAFIVVRVQVVDGTAISMCCRRHWWRFRLPRFLAARGLPVIRE